MVKLRSVAIHTGAAVALLMTITGCSTLKEGLASQVEVPTLEKQANRVAVGMTIVRENNIMAMKMPISGDALWPAQVAADISDAQAKIIVRALKNGPYYSTIRYSEPIQRKMLGSSGGMNALSKAAGFDMGSIAGAVSDPISPLTYRAIQKIIILYGKDRSNWPDPFKFDSSLESFLDFKDGKMKMVEAGTTDVYETLGDALISLTPTNYQKDLKLARDDMLKAYANTAGLEGEKGSLQAKLKGMLTQTGRSKGPSLSHEERVNINDRLAQIETELSQAKADADEKEKIYFTLLDDATTALKSDIRLDEDQIKLAKNVNLVSKEIQAGATEAYSAFGVAISNIAGQPIIQNFPKELQSLAIAAARFPRYAEKFKIRIERLVKNAIYFLPNISIGTYYAHKQAVLAEKYEDITTIIVEAAEAKAEADKAAAEDEKKNSEEETPVSEDMK